jgi:hypothetical protein
VVIRNWKNRVKFHWGNVDQRVLTNSYTGITTLFFGGTMVLAQSLLLARHSTSWKMPQPFFALVIFGIKSLIWPGAGLGSRCTYLCLPHNWNIRNAPPIPSLLVGMGIPKFLHELPLNSNFPDMYLSSSWEHRCEPPWPTQE